MINDNILSQAVQFTSNLGSSRLVARENTPIEELNTLSRHPFSEYIRNPKGSGKDGVNDFVYEVANTTKRSHDSVTHTQILEMRAKEYADVMCKRLDTLHDVYVPLIGRITSRVEESIHKEIPSVPTIEKLEFGDLYQHVALKGLLSQYDPSVKLSSNYLSGHDVREEADIARLLSTGNISLDTLLIDLVASYPAGWLEDVYNKFFRNEETNKVLSLGDFLENKKEEVDTLIVVYVLANALRVKEEVDISISQTLHDYQFNLNNFIHHVAVNLKTKLTIHSERISSGAIVASYTDEIEGIIYVYGDNYDSYLSKGGTPESIFGYNISTSYENNIDSILARKDTYENLWNNYYLNRLQSIDKKINESIYNSLNEVMADELLQLPSETLSTFHFPSNGVFTESNQGDQVTKETVIDLVRLLVSKIPELNLGKDIPAIVKSLLIDFCLSHLRFGPFLTRMEQAISQASEAGVTITPREACFYAAAEEIVRLFVTTMVDVVPNQVEV